MSPGQSRPQGGHGVSWNWGPTRISEESPSKSWNQNVGNVGPKNAHVERSDLAKRFFIAGWERERAESQEREGERGRGLNTPQWDSA
jgi:hypothetical protein